MKTIRIFKDQESRGLIALIELSPEDLRGIGAVDYSSQEVKVDPAAALKKVVDYQAQAFARAVTEGGLVEVARTALGKLIEWGKAARAVKVSSPALWQPEPDEEEEPKTLKTKCAKCSTPLDVTAVICGACVDKDKAGK